MTDPQGYLANPAAQKAVQELELEFQAFDDADVEELLRHDWGRRLAMRFVYALGRLDSLAPLHPGPGMTVAELVQRHEGMREIATVIAGQMKRVSRELWLLAHEEKWATDASRGERRSQAESTPSNEG